MVELQSRWVRGQGEVPNELFDPQFACSQEDFKFCKGIGKSCYSYQHGKHAADYKVYNRMAKGKAKGQSAVGGTGQPAVGGKGKSVLDRGSSFESNILRLCQDGTWSYRTGKCMSLAHLFLKCGESFTMAKLYEYYNLCRPIATKKPHAWSSPARQSAASERWARTGRYGHGS